METLDRRKINLLLNARNQIEIALNTYTVSELNKGHAQVLLDKARREFEDSVDMDPGELLYFPGELAANQVAIPADAAAVYPDLINIAADLVGMNPDLRPRIRNMFVAEEMAHLKASEAISTIEERGLGLSFFWIPADDGSNLHYPGFTAFLRLKGTATVAQWRQILVAPSIIDPTGSDAIKLGIKS